MIEVALDAGPHVARARITNDFYDPKNPDPKRRDRNLGVARVLIEGPLGPTPDSDFERRAQAIAGDGADGERLRRVAATIGEECFRRPLAREEVDALAVTAIAAAGAQAAFDAQLRALVTALLVDPRFVLRVEAVPQFAAGNGHAALSGLELASRLSFFVWSSVPDAELRRAAAAGELARPDPRRDLRHLRDGPPREAGPVTGWRLWVPLLALLAGMVAVVAGVALLMAMGMNPYGG